MLQKPLCCMFLVFSPSVAMVEVRGAERAAFELRGTLDTQGGISLDPRFPIRLRALSGLRTGKEFTATPGTGGSFRFKSIPTGTYILTATIPRVARVKRTVEVGPSLADREGRIEVRFQLAARPRRPGAFQVPADTLAIPAAAREEYRKGLEQLRDQNLARAEKHFRQAIELAPQLYTAWYQLGVLADRQERQREAADLYRESLKLRPENSRALMALGDVLLAMRDIPEAVSVNALAAKIRPDEPQAQIQLGLSLILANRLDEAEGPLKEAIALDPANYLYPQLMLAEIYRRRNDASAVKRQLEEFLRLHPDTPRAREIRQALAGG